jgi:hypothetical protein
MFIRGDDLSTDIAGHFLAFLAGYSVAPLFFHKCYITTGAMAHESTGYKGLKLVIIYMEEGKPHTHCFFDGMLSLQLRGIFAFRLTMTL